jgi:hypothetical protein
VEALDTVSRVERTVVTSTTSVRTSAPKSEMFAVESGGIKKSGNIPAFFSAWENKDARTFLKLLLV